MSIIIAYFISLMSKKGKSKLCALCTRAEISPLLCVNHKTIGPGIERLSNEAFFVQHFPGVLSRLASSERLLRYNRTETRERKKNREPSAKIELKSYQAQKEVLCGKQ